MEREKTSLFRNKLFKVGLQHFNKDKKKISFTPANPNRKRSLKLWIKMSKVKSTSTLKLKVEDGVILQRNQGWASVRNVEPPGKISRLHAGTQHYA